MFYAPDFSVTYSFPDVAASMPQIVQAASMGDAALVSVAVCVLLLLLLAAVILFIWKKHWQLDGNNHIFFLFFS